MNYYIYFNRFGKTNFSKSIVVEKNIFDLILPHKKDLECGKIPIKLNDLLDFLIKKKKAVSCTELDLAPNSNCIMVTIYDEEI